MSSSDSSASESFEPTEFTFCAIHVTNAKGKIISFSDKSYLKCKECATKWIKVEETQESKVADKFLAQIHEGVGVGQCISDVAESGEADSVDDFTSRNGRKRRTTLGGYHVECYRHFCNITTISRALTRFQKKKDAEEKSSLHDIQEESATEDAPAPKHIPHIK